MFPTGLNDLDALILKCRNAKARSYLEEAVVCLKVGAIRAAIVTTWVAVVHDLLAKFEQLALGSDKNAQAKVDAFRKIVEDADVKASLEFERTVLEVARDDFEFFGQFAYEDLVRLREDRNRCAHPSMIDPETDYQPPPELARTHVVAAVTHLLEQGPAQGKAAMSRLLRDLEQPFYPEDLEDLTVHLEQGPLGRPRASLVRNFVLVLLKRFFEAAEEIAENNLLGNRRARREREKKQQRASLTLRAVLEMHPEAARRTLAERLDDLVSHLADENLDDALALCAALPELWSLLSEAQRNRITRFVITDSCTLALMVLSWSIPALRHHVTSRLRSNRERDWVALAQEWAAPEEWVVVAMDLMAEGIERGEEWERANHPRAFICARISSITEAQVERVIKGVATHPDMIQAWGVRDVLHALAKSPSFGLAKLEEMIATTGNIELFSKVQWRPAAA